MHRSYPLVYRLIELTLILPVATASVERVFSAMSIIKTDLRNKMGDEWLNDLMICYTEKEIFRSISNEKIMKRFEEMKERLMLIPQKIVVCFITISFFLSLKLIFALSLIYFLLFIDHSCRRMMYVVMGWSHVIIIYFAWYGQIQTVTFILLRCNLSYSSMFQYKIALKCIVGLMVCVRYMNFCSFVSLV